jgi:predicted transcriptional regulator
MDGDHQLRLIGEIVSAYVANNSLPTKDLPAMIFEVAKALDDLSGNGAEEKAAATPVPAVPIRRSITPDYIICLEDGRKFRTLKRALMARYGLTPEEYRRKWGLPADYPMVAPNYSAARAVLAKATGFGQGAR